MTEHWANRVPAGRTDKGDHPDLIGEELPPRGFASGRVPVIREDAPRTRGPAPRLADSNFLDASGKLDMAKVQRYQNQLPQRIQNLVADRTWPGNFAEGFTLYRQTVDELNRQHGTVEVTDEQIADMPLEQYDKLFYDNGKPRDGVIYRKTRSIDVEQRGGYHGSHGQWKP